MEKRLTEDKSASVAPLSESSSATQGDVVLGKKRVNGPEIHGDVQNLTLNYQLSKHNTRVADNTAPSPRADLESNIRAAYQIIRKYEAIRLEETDRPEVQARAKRQIAEQKVNIRDLLAEYLPRYRADMPDDIRKIAEYCGLS